MKNIINIIYLNVIRNMTIGDWIIINDPIITCDTDTDSNFIMVNIKHREDSEEQINKYALRVKKNIVLMDFKSFVNDICKSYKYSFNNIKKQFMIDVPRSVLTINGITNGTTKSFYNIIMNNPWISRQLSYIIISLCTQATLATPFEILHNTYIKEAKNNKQQLYLSDSKDNTNKEKMNIYLTLNKEQQKMYITKKLRIFRINSEFKDDTIYKINLFLAINFKEGDKYVKFWWKFEQVKRKNK